MNLETTAALTQPATQDTLAPDPPFTYEQESKTFKSLLDAHTAGERQQCANRRVARRHRVNVAQMRQGAEGKDPELLPDETIIPDRTIETNIAQEKPLYTQYVEQPQTIISFSDYAQKGVSFESLEHCLTDLFKYKNWKLPWFHLIDSILLHGGGFLEVLFDPASPAKFVIEYVRRDHLIIPKGTKSLDNCQRYGRLYQLTKLQFDKFVIDYNFNPAIATKIKEHHKQKEDFIEVYKYYLVADDNYIYTAWLADPCIGADDFLRPPSPFFNGDFSTPDPEMVEIMSMLGFQPPAPQPLPTTKSSIVFFPYSIEEDESILEIQGRAALDIHTQDAQTTLYSAGVNGSHRASRFYPVQELQQGDEPSAELIKIKHGQLIPIKGKLNLFQPEYPNQVLLSMAQSIGVRNATQSGQVDFAAITRQDTAKRATEILAAQEQAAQLNSSKISLFSQSSLQVWQLAWNIVLNQVKIGQLQLNGVENVDIFSPSLTLTMSADAQVVRRAERINKYVNHYALVVGTKFQDAYFKTMLEAIFPEEFPKWLQEVGILTAQEQALALAMTSMAAVPPENVPQEVRQDYMNTIDQIAATLPQPPQQAQQAQQNGPPS